jgi:hypothetical protein
MSESNTKKRIKAVYLSAREVLSLLFVLIISSWSGGLALNRMDSLTE